MLTTNTLCRARAITGAFVAVLGLAGPAAAETFAVSASGSDSGDGKAVPFRTFGRAISALRGGDTLMLRAGTYRERLDLHGLDGVTVRGEAGTVLDGAASGADFGVYATAVSSLVLENLTFRNFSVNGIYYEGGQNLVARNCDFSYNGLNGALIAGIDNVTVENCTASFNRSGHGIYMSVDCDAARLIGNRCFGNGQAGLQVNPLGYGGDQLSSDFLIAGNTMYGNGTRDGGAAMRLYALRNSTVVNNLIYDNPSGGIYLSDGGGGYSFGSKDNQILHNTVVIPSGEHAFKCNPGSTGNRVYDNVFVCRSGSAIKAFEPIQSDYNCLWGAASANWMSLGSWRASTGNDLHSVEGDPRLGSDFRPVLGSPLRDTGTSVYSTDKDGRPRPQGPKPDLGCYEAAGAVTPRPPRGRGLKPPPRPRRR